MTQNAPSSWRHACEKRLPFLRPFIHHMAHFPMPPVTWLWGLGACLIVALFLMGASGLFLAIHYTADNHLAFNSIEEIERRIPSGWFIRAVHMGGATMLFAALYGHIGRGLWYGSYKAPREYVWISGLLLMLLFMTTAFAGYVLPWGQMSYWAANVITHAIEALPGIGPSLAHLLLGEDTLDNNALHRLFVLHFTLGFVAVALVAGHILCLHGVGPSNPTLDSPQPIKETRPFHPYYSTNDGLVLCLFLFVYTVLIFFLPDWLEKTANLAPANPLKTPASITPEWYLAPFYAMLRAVPSRFGGMILCTCSVVGLFALPWLDRSPRHNARYRPVVRIGMILFFLAFLTLIVAGLHEETPLWLWISRGGLLIYFTVLFILLPFAAAKERNSLPLHTSLGAVILLVLSSPLSAKTITPEERGFIVFQQVCSACHGMEHAHYGDMAPLNSSLSALKDWARLRQNAGLDTPISSPYPSIAAARAANGGDFPPDMSHITQRIKGGPDYIEKMLQNYATPPEGMIMAPHSYYNPIALTHHKHFRMPPPLHDGMLIYPDDTKATTAQMAHDVTTFLIWANDPHQKTRHFIGCFVVAYLLLMTALVFVFRKHIWRR